jgi:mRNA interferase MazF
MNPTNPNAVTPTFPQRGEAWWVDFGRPGQPGRPVGHEQGFARPALVVSADRINRSPRRLHAVVPLTTQAHGPPLHVPVLPPDGNHVRPSFALVEQARAVSRDRFDRWLGCVSSAVLVQIEDRLRLLFSL